MSDPGVLRGEKPTWRSSTLVRGVRRVFFGADGLRAGWSFILFYLMVWLMQVGVKAVFAVLHQPNPDELRLGARYPAQLLITNGIPFVAVAAATFFMAWIERRSFRIYGIGTTPGAVRQFLEGVFWGAALLILLVFALWGFHLLAFDGLQLGGFDALRFGVEWFVGFLCVGLFEEFITRGFVLFTLARGIAGPLRFTRFAAHARAVGFWAVAVLTSCLFGLGHGGKPGESPLGLVSAGLVAFAFALSLWRTGSLWWAIGMHTAWDWAQSFVFGVADSGHVVALNLLHSHPLGRVILYALPTLALSFVIIVWTLRPTGWPAAWPTRGRGDVRV